MLVVLDRRTGAIKRVEETENCISDEEASRRAAKIFAEMLRDKLVEDGLLPA